MFFSDILCGFSLLCFLDHLWLYWSWSNTDVGGFRSLLPPAFQVLMIWEGYNGFGRVCRFRVRISRHFCWCNSCFVFHSATSDKPQDLGGTTILAFMYISTVPIYIYISGYCKGQCRWLKILRDVVRDGVGSRQQRWWIFRVAHDCIDTVEGSQGQSGRKQATHNHRTTRKHSALLCLWVSFYTHARSAIHDISPWEMIQPPLRVISLSVDLLKVNVGAPGVVHEYMATLAQPPCRTTASDEVRASYRNNTLHSRKSCSILSDADYAKYLHPQTCSGDLFLPPDSMAFPYYLISRTAVRNAQCHPELESRLHSRE